MDFVTARLQLKSVQPDVANVVAKRYGLEEDSIELVRKGILSEDLPEFEKGECASIDVITTKSVDRDGEIIDSDGIIFDDFNKHPIVMWAHDYKSLPLGRCAWIKRKGDGLIAKTIYAVNSNPFAKQVYEYRRDGFPLAKSIGIIPISVQKFTPTKDNGGLKRKYLKSLMLEYSDTPVPSNPGALELAVSKGITTLEEVRKIWPGMDFEEIDLGAINISDMIQKGVIAYKTYPVTDESWSAAKERKAATVDDLMVICAWVEDKPKAELTKGDFSLPHHIIDGYKVSRAGCHAAAAVLGGARGGMKGLSEEELNGCREHIGKHYKNDLEETPPWEADIKGWEEYQALCKDLNRPFGERTAELEKSLFGEVITMSKKVTCPQCEARFDYTENLDKSGDFAVCPECGTKVTKAGDVYEAASTKSKLPEVTCEVCGKKVVFDESKKNGVGGVACSECGEVIDVEGKRCGDKKKKDLDDIVAKKFDETDNELRFRIEDPDKFDKFRTFALQKKKPQVFAVYGHVSDGKDDEWVIQALRFPKEDWTKEDAQKWVKDHPDVTNMEMKTLTKGLILPMAAVVKDLDTSGHVSTSDIISALQGYICEKLDANGGGAPWKEGKSYSYVVDLYPFNYPNGNVIFAVSDKDGVKNFQAEYVYKDGGEVEVSNTIELKREWTKKSMSEAHEIIKMYFPDDTTELESRLRVAIKRYEAQDDQIAQLNADITALKEVESEYLVLKEGRVLSDKNRKLIQAAVEALSALITATEPVTQKDIGDDILAGVSVDDVKAVVKEVIKDSLGGAISVGLIKDSLDKAMAKHTGKAVSTP